MNSKSVASLSNLEELDIIVEKLSRSGSPLFSAAKKPVVLAVICTIMNLASLELVRREKSRVNRPSEKVWENYIGSE
jgi:hypothetical protein